MSSLKSSSLLSTVIHCVKTVTRSRFAQFSWQSPVIPDFVITEMVARFMLCMLRLAAASSSLAVCNQGSLLRRLY